MALRLIRLQQSCFHGLLGSSLGEQRSVIAVELDGGCLDDIGVLPEAGIA